MIRDYRKASSHKTSHKLMPCLVLPSCLSIRESLGNEIKKTPMDVLEYLLHGVSSTMFLTYQYQDTFSCPGSESNLGIQGNDHAEYRSVLNIGIAMCKVSPKIHGLMRRRSKLPVPRSIRREDFRCLSIINSMYGNFSNC